VVALEQNFELLAIGPSISDYGHAISKQILQLDFPHSVHSYESLNIPIVPFPRSLLYIFTLEWNFELLTF